MLTKSNIGQSKAMEDKIRVAVTQAILQIVGPDHVIRIVSGHMEIADLLPSGQNLSLKMSIDIYEKP